MAEAEFRLSVVVSFFVSWPSNYMVLLILERIYYLVYFKLDLLSEIKELHI